MLTIGLTGGIGSGKSEVARLFSRLGVPVIDADVIAHELVRPGEEALSEVVAVFGEQILAADGSLARKKLGDIVFNDPEKKQQLEAIIHPRVREQIRACKDMNKDEPYIVVVIPLLLESGQHDLVDRVLIVVADESVRIGRVQARDGRNLAQIEAIIQSQADDRQRLAAADEVLDNNGSLDDLQHAVQQLHQKYAALAAQDNFM
jgi:dephospho-CoA kinase